MQSITIGLVVLVHHIYAGIRQQVHHLAMAIVGGEPKGIDSGLLVAHL
jgi:hypothetical protein